MLNFFIYYIIPSAIIGTTVIRHATKDQKTFDIEDLKMMCLTYIFCPLFSILYVIFSVHEYLEKIQEFKNPFYKEKEEKND